MKRAITGSILALFICGPRYSQAVDQSLDFEVASVKLAPPRVPGSPRGMMGCFLSNASRYTCKNASISLMVVQAYGLRAYQLRPPVSEDETRFNVEANVPPGATAEQVTVMLQNLLTERFKLAFHRLKAEVEGYALVVAKSGLKIKESVPDPPRAPTDGGRTAPPEPIKNTEGFNNFRVRSGFTVSQSNGLTRWVGTEVPVDAVHGANLCGILNSVTGQPVVDSTGLKERYDLTFTFGADSAAAARVPATVPSSAQEQGSLVLGEDSGPTLFEALEQQLGLKLERRKVMIDAFVIDHAEKRPSEN
jgi:uncharacterized protein (TIGR03435 family)